MKATILADGTLSIVAESELEAYALSSWCLANLDYRRIDVHLPKVIVDFSAFPGAVQTVGLSPLCKSASQQDAVAGVVHVRNGAPT